MQYGLCNHSIVGLRREPSDRSELTSQLLYGELFKVLEHRKKWSKIRLSFDKYEGFHKFPRGSQKLRPSVCLGLSAAVTCSELLDLAAGLNLSCSAKN